MILIFIVTGYVCSVALGCDRPMPAISDWEHYPTMELCEARIDHISHNIHVLSAHLTCAATEIEPVPQS